MGTAARSSAPSQGGGDRRRRSGRARRSDGDVSRDVVRRGVGERGVNGIPGFSTSSFAIEQRTVSTGAGWEAHKSSSAPGVVSFGDVAQDLAPGAQTFGWVMVRATQDATVGGTITLRSTYTTGDSALGDALRYSARLIPDGASCTAGLYDTAGVELVPDGSTLDTDAVTTFRVEPGTGGAPGAEQIVCFELEFPAGSGSGLQGQSLEALWVLEAESD